jgi:hypothetical protein
MFIQQLNTIFADYITDGVIRCEQEVFKNGLDEILKENENNEPSLGKRKVSKFMRWLNANRISIKEEYFTEFDIHTDWSKEGTIKYYTLKDIPLDKLKILITKKEKKGSTTFKPRLMTLITTKAGQLWSRLDDDEKDNINIESPNISVSNVEDNVEERVVSSRNKKKGRPKGIRPKNSVSDISILDNIQMMNTLNNVDEEVDIHLYEFVCGDDTYYKDDFNNVYSFDDECRKLGNYNDGKLEIFE